jgi:hypothetical protein
MRAALLPQQEDLELLGIDAPSHARTTMLLSLAGAGFTVAGSAALAASGMATGVVATVVVASVAGSSPWLVRRSGVARRASEARADIDAAVSVFLDLVNVLLAGGAGIETSMVSAASCGDGWAFEHIRLAMARAQSSRRGYWEELREWGEACGVDSLVEVAHSAQLAGQHGARVRATLAAKSRALRTRNLARVEHDAERRTEQMGLPLVAMFVGFMVLIGYPALAGTIGAL